MITLEAVIEIGSTGIRLVIAEISGQNTWHIVDSSELPVALGWDVFTDGYVSRDTLLQCQRILLRFKEQLAGWALDESNTTVIATSALREARNRDLALDRIFVKTGFRIKIVDGVEENRLMYIAVMHSLQNEAPKLKKVNSIIMEAGGGSTEIMLLNHGEMAAVHSLRLGTVIIEQQIKSMTGTAKDTRRFLEESIRNTGENLNDELRLNQVQQFITIGGDAKLLAKQVGTQVSEKLWVIPRKTFDSFVETLQSYTTEECIARFMIPYSEARGLHINLLIYKLFINLTNAEEIVVPDTSLREGIILSKISGPNTKLQEEFNSQIIASALNLGKKYHMDEDHAQYVRTTALSLFDKLRHELGLPDRMRLLLEVASILHDVGMFIRGNEHHLHTFYIIVNSEIFGLAKDDMQIISNVARYHRGGIPTHNDINFSVLPRNDRTTVFKLAAILRIADALDRSHTQRIKNIDISFKSDRMVLHVRGNHDLSLERIALREKGDLFEAIFGYQVLL